MKKIDEYKLRAKKCKKISTILAIITLIIILLIITGNKAIIITSIILAIIIGNISSKYFNEYKELEDKIEYMKLHEEIIEDTKK